MLGCIIVESEESSRSTIEKVVNNIKHLSIIKSCCSINEARNELLNERVDLMFLEIASPDTDEYGFIDHLKEGRPRLIITSNSSDVAKLAFDLEAHDFVLKPLTHPRLVKALAKTMNGDGGDHHPEADISSSSIFIRTGQHFVKLDMKDIYVIEALADYVIIHTSLKRYTIHATMKFMESKLPKNDFARVHKSYIVRLDSILKLERNSLLIDKKTIPISGTYREQLMHKLQVI